MNGTSGTFSYGPNGPTERELRLLGDVKGKRVLELGCGTGETAVALAQQGAVVIGIDTSEERLAIARARGDDAEVRVDWHHGDLADLAFLRADSIDVVVSIHVLSEVDDAARLFRQVERVLRPNAPFVFSAEHPVALCVGPGDTFTHSPFDRGPISVNGRLLYVRSISEVFTDLHRAGLRADTLLEPRQSNARTPTIVVWRARTDTA
jgi:ubiquinone/menaquinone biosynthesis C-methylase UbiE